MEKKQAAKRGGARKGAGRKATNKVEGEIKKSYTIRLYPSQVKELKQKYGSIQKAIDSL